MGTAVLAIIVMVAGGVGLGVIIGVAAKIFAVETDSRIEEVGEMLPGANCGACGYAGCADFAKSLVAGESAPGDCPVCDADAVSSIAGFLGLSADTGEKMVAVVLCGGDDRQARRSALYNGVADCRSASLVAGGAKGCAHGCLGFASCARACPFGAIEMRDGLAIVHPDLCVGCGKCVETCPRGLIKMVPAAAQVHVFCSSPEKGAAKKKVCDVPCIGCRKCVKNAEESQFDINGFLVQVNYGNPPPASVVEEAGCPTKCLKSAAEIERKPNEEAA